MRVLFVARVVHVLACEPVACRAPPPPARALTHCCKTPRTPPPPRVRSTLLLFLLPPQRDCGIDYHRGDRDNDDDDDDDADDDDVNDLDDRRSRRHYLSGGCRETALAHATGAAGRAQRGRRAGQCLPRTRTESTSAFSQLPCSMHAVCCRVVCAVAVVHSLCALAVLLCCCAIIRSQQERQQAQDQAAMVSNNQQVRGVSEKLRWSIYLCTWFFCDDPPQQQYVPAMMLAASCGLHRPVPNWYHRAEPLLAGASGLTEDLRPHPKKCTGHARGTLPASAEVAAAACRAHPRDQQKRGEWWKQHKAAAA